VFEVSGNINLGGTQMTVWNPYLTIAGQTAPSPGISVINGSFVIASHDVLVQHIRTRGGAVNTRRLPLAVQNEGLNYVNPVAYNIVFDHVSTSWSTDDLVTSWGGARDITYRNVLATGELYCPSTYSDCGGKVALNDSADRRILINASAFLTGYGRMPLAQANPFVFVNNVVYNWGGTATELQRQPRTGIEPGGEFAFVDNLYLKGPLNPSAYAQKPIFVRCDWNAESKIYLKGNVAPDFTISTQADLIQNDTGKITTTRCATAYSTANMLISAPSAGVWPQGLTSRSASDSTFFDWVLNNAGAFPHARDSVDTKIVADARARQGGLIGTTVFPTIAQNYRALTLPTNPNGDDDGDGYTNLEEMLHQMAAQVESGSGSSASDTTAPSTPTGLTATAVSSSQINLSWTASTDNTGVAGYKIYRAGAQIGTVTSGTTYQSTGLSPATTYSYTVAAYDAAGNTSLQSGSVSATTQSGTTVTAPYVERVETVATDGYYGGGGSGNDWGGHQVRQAVLTDGTEYLLYVRGGGAGSTIRNWRLMKRTPTTGVWSESATGLTTTEAMLVRTPDDRVHVVSLPGDKFTIASSPNFTPVTVPGAWPNQSGAYQGVGISSTGDILLRNQYDPCTPDCSYDMDLLYASAKWNGTSWDWNPLVRKNDTGSRYSYDYILPNKFNPGEFLSMQLRNAKTGSYGITTITDNFIWDGIRILRSGMTSASSYTISDVMPTITKEGDTTASWMSREDAFVDSRGRLFTIHRVTDPNGRVPSGQYLTVKDGNLNTIYQGLLSDQNGNATVFEDGKGRMWVYRMQSAPSGGNPLARLHRLNDNFTLGTTWTISTAFAGKPYAGPLRLAVPRGGNVIGDTLHGMYPYNGTIYAFKIRLPD
jgi:chitodextrinase